MVINVRSNVYVNMTSSLPDVCMLTRLLLQSAWAWMVEMTGTGMGVRICACPLRRPERKRLLKGIQRRLCYEDRGVMGCLGSGRYFMMIGLTSLIQKGRCLLSSSSTKYFQIIKTFQKFGSDKCPVPSALRVKVNTNDTHIHIEDRYLSLNAHNVKLKINIC